MSGIDDLKTTRAILRELARIVKFTRQTLAGKIQGEEGSGRSPNEGQPGRLADTLDHMGDVREGFILSQRTSPNVSLSDLRDLVKHILLDWQWVQEMNMALAPANRVETIDHQLVVYNHALITLAILPNLPADVITFPQPRPSYRDVPAPVLPGDLLARIEEIEQMLYQAEFKPISSLDYGPFRRTYAFFEASDWLVSNYLDPLL